jgi:hypothetical protein
MSGGPLDYFRQFIVTLCANICPGEVKIWRLRFQLLLAPLNQHVRNIEPFTTTLRAQILSER